VEQTPVTTVRIPASRTWHVKPRQGSWLVQRADASRAESIHRTRDEATERAIALARRYRGKVRIVGESRRFETEFAFPEGDG
jgi:hypothetical protein